MIYTYNLFSSETSGVMQRRQLQFLLAYILTKTLYFIMFDCILSNIENIHIQFRMFGRTGLHSFQ
jgi:hypothetical protein